MHDHCTIELHANRAWREVGAVSLAGPATQGWRTPTHAGYDTAWAVGHLEARDAHAFCSGYPVGVVDFQRPHWPVFLSDMLPQGSGREELSKRLGLPEMAADGADWRLLLAGAGNPIGNLRVKEAAQWLARTPDAGRRARCVASKTRKWLRAPTTGCSISTTTFPTITRASTTS